LDERGAALVGALDAGAGRTVASLSDASERLRGEFSGLLDRLGEANRLLQEVVAGAGGNLGAIEEGLAGRLRQIEELLASVAVRTGQASGALAEQVKALRDVSEEAMREADGLVRSLDERGRALSEITRVETKNLGEGAAALERVEERVTRSLAERCETLEALLERVGERRATLEEVTTGFTAFIDETLRGAETRVRQLGGVLSNSARTTTGALGEQLELIRAATGEESERTAAALRAISEQVRAEVNGSLEGATARFREATTELTAMAAAIQKELDETRQELRRGVLDIPRETQDATAQMRRVVADQIKALTELTALVSRSGRTADAAPPAGRRRESDAAPATAGNGPARAPPGIDAPHGPPASRGGSCPIRSGPAAAALPGPDAAGRDLPARSLLRRGRREGRRRLAVRSSRRRSERRALRLGAASPGLARRRARGGGRRAADAGQVAQFDLRRHRPHRGP
jgi:hypothetical protein